MEKNISKLTYLMNALDIRGIELATALHVDYSLISKWKNHKRPLTTRSVYLKKIADYILSIDSAAKKEFILQILKNYDPILQIDSPKEVHNCLCRFLSEPPQAIQSYSKPIFRENRNTYQTEFKVYKGNEGRRRAIMELLDYTLAMPEGQQLFLVNQEDMTWLVEDTNYLDSWNGKLFQLLKKNHRLKIIHSVDRQVVDLASVIRQWLPLHLTGGIESYYFPKYIDSSFKITLLIVENTAALTGIVVDEDLNTRYTALYNDKVTIKLYESIFEKWLTESLPLIEMHSITEIDHFLDKVFEMGQKSENSYFYADIPLFITLSENLLTKILQDNNIEETMIKKCLYYHQQVNSNFHSNIDRIANRHIYSLAKLENLLHADKILYNDLSLITGRNISVSKEYFQQHLRLLAERLDNNESFEIALLSTENKPNTIPVALWFKQNSLITAWSSASMPYALTANETTLVNAFYYYYDSIWNSIPRINRRKDWVKNQLYKLIALG